MMRKTAEQNRLKGPPARILLATDLSARCDRALDRSAALAAAWQAELIAAHALEQTDDFYATDLERRLPSWRRPPDAARMVEDQLRHDMMQAAPNVVAIVEKGEPTELVLRVADTRGCDLIVTGTHGRRGINRMILGSQAIKVLHHSEIPVLVVR